MTELSVRLCGELLAAFVFLLGVALQSAAALGRIPADLHSLSCTTVHPGQVACLALCFVVAAAATRLFYTTCRKKMDRRRGPDDVGYQLDPKDDRRAAVNCIRRLRTIGEVPPAYANGWYALLESHRLKRGEAQTVNMTGLVLAVFREESGVARVVDAYCPHLGANLGAGGRVRGDCIECPFHGWRFRGEDGRCVAVPALKDGKIPEMARVKTYHVHELNGWINFWYDAEEREPFWTISDYEDINNGNFTFCGRTEHYINCHMEDVPENGADLAHLPIIHGPSMFAGIDLRYVTDSFWSFTEQKWDSTWRQESPPDGHLAYMDLEMSLTFLGKTIPFTRMQVHVDQIGPAIVYLTFNTPFGRCVIQHVVCPVEPMLQKLVHNLYTNRWMPLFVAKIFLVAMVMQVERDLTVWNNKKYASRPVLLKTPEDSLILRHRRWFSQFYSENSPKVRMRSADGLDW